MSAIPPSSRPTAGLGDIIALRQQLLERNQALRELHQPSQAGEAGSATQPAGGFADTLKHALGEVNQAQHKAGELSAAYERGEVTDIAQVMLARQEAGVAFEASLQVRNKLLSAYQEIMRMGG